MVQSLVNEGDLLRIKLLDRSEQTRADAASSTAAEPDNTARRGLESDSPPLPTNRPSLLSPLPPTAPSNSQHFSDPTSLTFSERSDLLFSNFWNKTKETFKSIVPLKKLEEGEFKEKLEESRDIKRVELERVRNELRELEKLEKGE